MKVLFLLMLCFLIGTVPSLWAAWVEDGVLLCTTFGEQSNVRATSDGTGGAIITWQDLRSSQDIYAQRVNASGSVEWDPGGVPICTFSFHQKTPEIASDGAGGAIIVWLDERSGDNIYAQRVNASGTILWTTNGIPICSAPINLNYLRIISDGVGGAIVMWEDFRSGVDQDIYAQRIDASGITLWPANGVPICTATDDQRFFELTSDGAGGAIAAWEDWRGGNNKIYAQRINALGAVQWTTDGVLICAAGNNQYSPAIASDEAGGAIIVWGDFRNENMDIYAQRINASGITQWTTDGVILCSAVNNQSNAQLISDGAGGAMVVWQDPRVDYYSNIYVQRINALGITQWTTDGVPLCTALNSQSYPHLISDGAGGAIATWSDLRSGSHYDIYAQRINASGAVQWATDGIHVCSASDGLDQSITSNGTSGVIVSWAEYDYMDGGADVYAQKIDASGCPGWMIPILTNPSNGTQFEPGSNIELEWDPVSGADLYRVRIGDGCGFGSITDPVSQTSIIYIESIEKTYHWQVQARNSTSLVWSSWSDCRTFRVVSKYEIAVPEVLQSEEYWYWAACSEAVLTYYSPYVSQCEIANYARENCNWGEYDCCNSPAGSICDVGNGLYGTACSADLILGHWGVGSAGLSSSLPLVEIQNEIIDGNPILVGWDDDIGEGHIVVGMGVWGDSVLIMDPWPYGFPPEYANGGCHWVHYDWLVDDASHETWTVTLKTWGITTSTNTPSITYLDQNFPNPFNPMTDIIFGLKEPAFVSLRIYDVSGRLVKVLAEGNHMAGRHEVAWNGENSNVMPVASGLYFYRLVAGDFVQTKKMVLLR